MFPLVKNMTQPSFLCAAELIAGGGVCGAEGSIWLAVSGEPEQVAVAEEILKSVGKEPLFEL